MGSPNFGNCLAMNDNRTAMDENIRSILNDPDLPKIDGSGVVIVARYGSVI